MAKIYTKRSFTLIEIAVAMSIFAILMLIMMQLFGSIQSIWRRSYQKAVTAGDARFVNQLIRKTFSSLTKQDADNSYKALFYYQKDPSKSKIDNPSLWLLSVHPLNNQTTEYEIAFYLNKKSTISGSTPLYDLYANITSRADTENYDATASDTPWTTYGRDPGTGSFALLLLENVADFHIDPIPQTAAASGNGTADAPKRIQVTLTLLENPEMAERYSQATDDEVKSQYTRTYTLILERKTN